MCVTGYFPLESECRVRPVQWVWCVPVYICQSRGYSLFKYCVFFFTALPHWFEEKPNEKHRKNTHRPYYYRPTQVEGRGFASCQAPPRAYTCVYNTPYMDKIQRLNCIPLPWTQRTRIPECRWDLIGEPGPLPAASAGPCFLATVVDSWYEAKRCTPNTTYKYHEENVEYTFFCLLSFFLQCRCGLPHDQLNDQTRIPVVWDYGRFFFFVGISSYRLALQHTER